MKAEWEEFHSFYSIILKARREKELIKGKRNDRLDTDTAIIGNVFTNIYIDFPL